MKLNTCVFLINIDKLLKNIQKFRIKSERVFKKDPSVIFIHSVFKMGKNYYAQVFVEECKCVARKKMQIYLL